MGLALRHRCASVHVADLRAARIVSSARPAVSRNSWLNCNESQRGAAACRQTPPVPAAERCTRASARRPPRTPPPHASRNRARCRAA